MWGRGPERLTLVAAPPPHRKGIEVAATACGCYKTPVTATRRLWPCFAGGVKGSHGKHTGASRRSHSEGRGGWRPPFRWRRACQAAPRPWQGERWRCRPRRPRPSLSVSLPLGASLRRAGALPSWPPRPEAPLTAAAATAATAATEAAPPRLWVPRPRQPPCQGAGRPPSPRACLLPPAKRGRRLRRESPRPPVALRSPWHSVGRLLPTLRVAPRQGQQLR